MAIINTFVIIPTVEITDDMVNESLNSTTSMRKNVDESKSILKFSGICFPNSCVGYNKYNYEEIQEILLEEEWQTE